MEARFSSVAVLAAALLACGANYRSENFIVHSCSSDRIGNEICAAAEAYRRDLAIEWLGHELPPWQEPCPINASRVAPHEGAGGKTSFYFRNGVPFNWDMEVYGTRERVLDSVLPHEVTHTIFATHFGQPLPRWADEGGSTTVEHPSEKAKQDANLIRFLKSDKGIAFNQMFRMKEYPREMLPLYSQGYSLTRFLIMHGGEMGKRKFVAYVGDGLAGNNWTKATREHYGYQSLSELQVAWLAWVKTGSPTIVPSPNPAPQSELAAAPAPQDEESMYPVQAAGRTRGTEEQPLNKSYEQPPRPGTLLLQQAEQASAANSGAYQQSNVARPTTGGWYARQKDRMDGATRPQQGSAGRGQNPAANLPPAERPNTEDGRPPLPGRKLLMEWSRKPAGMGGDTPIYAADERNASSLATNGLLR